MNKKSSIAICVALFSAAAVFTVLIFNTEPEAQREAATKRGPMLVQVISAEKGDFNPLIRAMGVVVPSQTVTLSAHVRGEVLSISEAFTPGSYVQKREPLLQIDDADYALLLSQRRSQLTQAKSTLDIEMGEQALAEREYKRMGQSLSSMQEALVLREPQLASARAQLTSAEAMLGQAELDLKRTKVSAPFNAKVVDISVNLGSMVNDNTELGRLVGTDNYWIEATISPDRVPYLSAAGKDAPLDVKVADNTAWPKGSFKRGRLLSVIGELTAQSRMVKVLIEVPDPVNLGAELSSKADAPNLLLGSFVECHIPARTLKQVVRIERKYLRKNDTVWVMEEQALSIRDVEIQFVDEQYAYIIAGIEEGEAVVTSDLARVQAGAPLSLQEPEIGQQEKASEQ